MYNIVYVCTHFMNNFFFLGGGGGQASHPPLDFQFLFQDFQIQVGGSQDCLITNVSASTDKMFHIQPKLDTILKSMLNFC